MIALLIVAGFAGFLNGGFAGAAYSVAGFYMLAILFAMYDDANR